MNAPPYHRIQPFGLHAAVPGHLDDIQFLGALAHFGPILGHPDLPVWQDRPQDVDPLAPWPMGSIPVHEDVTYHVNLPVAHPGLAMTIEVSSYILH